MAERTTAESRFPWKPASLHPLIWRVSRSTSASRQIAVLQTVSPRTKATAGSRRGQTSTLQGSRVESNFTFYRLQKSTSHREGQETTSLEFHKIAKIFSLKMSRHEGVSCDACLKVNDTNLDHDWDIFFDDWGVGCWSDATSHNQAEPSMERHADESDHPTEAGSWFCMASSCKIVP